MQNLWTLLIVIGIICGFLLLQEFFEWKKNRNKIKEDE
jgi:hypothetical protein